MVGKLKKDSIRKIAFRINQLLYEYYCSTITGFESNKETSQHYKMHFLSFKGKVDKKILKMFPFQITLEIQTKLCYFERNLSNVGALNLYINS